MNRLKRVCVLAAFAVPTVLVPATALQIMAAPFASATNLGVKYSQTCTKYRVDLKSDTTETIVGKVVFDDSQPDSGFSIPSHGTAYVENVFSVAAPIGSTVTVTIVLTNGHLIGEPTHTFTKTTCLPWTPPTVATTTPPTTIAVVEGTTVVPPASTGTATSIAPIWSTTPAPTTVPEATSVVTDYTSGRTAQAGTPPTTECVVGQEAPGAPPCASLPTTGSETGAIIAWAVILLAIGAAAIVITRRHNPEGEVVS